MTLLARSVVGFLVESAAWAAIVGLIALTVSSPLWMAQRTRRAAVEALLWAASGAVLVASIAHRADGPLGPSATVGRRDLPLLWLAAGAAAASAALALWRRREPRDTE